MLSTKGIVSLISISRPPPSFLWRSSRSGAYHVVSIKISRPPPSSLWRSSRSGAHHVVSISRPPPSSLWRSSRSGAHHVVSISISRPPPSFLWRSSRSGAHHVVSISISRPPPLFLWRSSRSGAHHVVFNGLVLLVSLVSWIAAILTLLLWRKVRISVIFPLIPFAFHCTSRRQLLKQMSEQHSWHRPLIHLKVDLTSREVRKF